MVFWIGLASLIALCSASLVWLAFLFSQWEMTQAAGLILWTRGLHARHNWRHHTLRSFLEAGSWIGVIWTTYAHSLETNGVWYNLGVAFIYGNLSGIIVCLTSEIVVQRDHNHTTKSSSADRNTMVQLYVLFSLLYSTLGLIFWYCKYVCMAVLLSTIASAAMVLAGDFFVRMKTTRFAGHILQDRIQQALYNWRHNLVRSLLETSCWQCAIYASYCVTHKIISAVQFGTVVGILAVLACDAYEDREIKEFEEVTPQIMSKLQSILAQHTPAPQPSKRRHSKAMGSYTMAEVAKHKTLADGWIVVHSNVYDVSNWGDQHPGGRKTLGRFLGRDATDEILAFHAPWVLSARLPGFLIGTLSDPVPPTQIQIDFRQLRDYFERSGYFAPDMGYYVKKAVWLLGLFVLVWALVLSSTSTAVHMLAAVVLGTFLQQIAFVGHDAGHLSVFSTRAQNSSFGLLVGNLLSGISIGWWKETHNVHHAVPNSMADDPDIAHLPVFAVDKRMLGSLWNTYHERVMHFDAVAQLLIPRQHLLYLPVCAVARFNLYAQSVIRLLRNPSFSTAHLQEWVCELGYFAWLAVLLSHLNSAASMAAFLVVSHACSGLLNLQITLSHFSMPVNKGVEDDYGGDFYTRNVQASLDITCPELLDWVHGGLQFQALHHCFPRITRCFLRRSKPFIKALAARHNLPYNELSFLDANRDVLRVLRRTAEESRKFHPLLWDAANAKG